MEVTVRKRTQRIVAIDYLKAMATILVILAHALTKSQRLKIAGPFWISMAVPIFMIISGFTNSLSADRSDRNSWQELYQKQRIKNGLKRILVPYFIIVSLEYMIGFYQLLFLNTGPFIGFTFSDYLFYLLTGGTTPGSYYIPIMIQLILIFPLLLNFYRRSPNWALLFIGSFHFMFDFFANYLALPTRFYRLLIFRYLGFIILGIALYFSYEKVQKLTQKMTVFSIIYILFYSFGYRFKVFAKWPNTALPTAFWALTLVILAMEYLEKQPRNSIAFLMSDIGKASYHIFLVQKLLFGFGLKQILAVSHLNIFIQTLAALIICSFLGLRFYNRAI